MKLQKLCYYGQAWSLVWDGEPIFSERIEAWANGPICPDLYAVHRGLFDMDRSDLKGWGDPALLSPDGFESLDAVLDFYGDKSSHWLSELTHAEGPWKGARSGLRPGEPGSTEITHSAMIEYYNSLSEGR